MEEGEGGGTYGWVPVATGGWVGGWVGGWQSLGNQSGDGFFLRKGQRCQRENTVKPELQPAV